MEEKNHHLQGVSRRQVLVGAAAAALLAATPAALAKDRKPIAPRSPGRPQSSAIRRTMAASAVLPDGRVLITGGYARTGQAKGRPTALSSAAIYDPRTDEWTEAAPMTMARARHAAVTMPDGRVAVSGGIHRSPTASVEVYNPYTDTWESAEPLAHPRYDHTAAVSGQDLLVFGGNGRTMPGGVEALSLRTLPSALESDEVNY